MRALIQNLIPSRTLRWCSVVLWAAVIFWVTLHVALNRESVAAEVRDRLQEKLAERLPSFELGPEYEFGWDGVVWMGPLVVEPAPDGPTVRIKEIGVRPAWGALLRGKVEPRSVTLQDLDIRVDRRGERISELARDLRKGGRAAPKGDHPEHETGEWPLLKIEDARVIVEASHDDEEDHTLGPFRGWIEAARVKDRIEAIAEARFPPGGDAKAELRFDPNAGLDLKARADDVPMKQWVGPFLPPAVSFQSGVLSGTVHLSVPAEREWAEAEVRVGVERVKVAGERVSTQPVGPAALSYTGKVRYDRAEARLTLQSSRWTIGSPGVEMPFDAELELGPDPKIDLGLKVGPVDLQRLIAALPEQLHPAEDAPHVNGPIRVELRARGPLKRPAEWVTTLDLDTTALKENARNAPLVLRGPFSYQPTGGAGPGRTLWIGGKGASYVPIGELPPIVGLAVTTSEDAGFYAHQGFDLEGLQNGLAAAMGGSKLRGGSTLTQQLVKNIYLSSERTMARKITEALITIQVEAALPKQRILEVYLNIIEWGPGVYGIGEAARYYFGIDARSLDTKQAVFLASIIPNPTHWGPAFRHSGVTESWNQRLAGVLQTLHQRGNLGDAQYQRALDEQLVFRGESENATLTRGQ